MDYFSIKNGLFNGSPWEANSENNKLLYPISLEAGNYVLQLAALNTENSSNGIQMFNIDGSIEYYGQRMKSVLVINKSGHVIPDLTMNNSNILISLSVMNIFFENEDYTLDKKIVKIVGVEVKDADNNEIRADIISSKVNTVLPGMVYQLPVLLDFKIDCRDSGEYLEPNEWNSFKYNEKVHTLLNKDYLLAQADFKKKLTVKVLYTISDDPSDISTTNPVDICFKCKSTREPYVFTFLGEDNSIQSGMSFCRIFL